MPTGNIPFGAATINGKIYILGSEGENGLTFIKVIVRRLKASLESESYYENAFCFQKVA